MKAEKMTQLTMLITAVAGAAGAAAAATLATVAAGAGLRAQMQRTVHLEGLHGHARALGLTDDQAAEVIDRWATVATERGWTLQQEAAETRQGLALRALGEDWEPWSGAT